MTKSQGFSDLNGASAMITGQLIAVDGGVVMTG